MFKGTKTTAKTGLQTRLQSAFLQGLVIVSIAMALVARPEQANVSGHEHHDHGTVSSDAGDHLHGIGSDLGERADVQAFSLGALLGINEITTENFPVEPVAEVARKVAAELQPGIQRPIHVVSVSRRERTPLAAVSRNAAMCVIVLNTNPDGWAIWDRFFGRVPASERMNVVELAVAHEIGHCAEREMNGGEKLTASFNALEGEVFADIYATLYASQYMGERSQVALSTLRALRDEFASREPTHATGERLKALQPQFDDIQQRQLTPDLLAQTANQLHHIR